MEAVASFAAARRDRMREADSDLAPMVLSALTQWTADGDWYAELIDDASVLWLEAFEAEAPNADPDLFIGRFRDMLGEALSQTKEPSNPPTDAEVNRVTRWLSTATLNNATYLGNGAHGGKGMRWVTMRDSSVRETHRAANGEIADSDGTFDIGGYDLHYPGEPVGPPEIWINCVVGSTQVEWSGQDVIAVTRREHTGTFVKVRTGNGHELTITPNHPVLTSGGYVPARLLRPGDQVMATSLPVAPEVGNTPPSIEQVYRAAREHGMVGRVGGSAVNFHGDVAESEVEVVWPDSNLPLEVGGECREPALVGAHGREVPLVGNGLPGAGASVPAGRVPVGGILPAGSSVGGSYDVTSFLRSHPRHADAVRLGPITDRKAEGFQATEDGVPADTEFLAHLEYALASGMALVDIVEVELYSATHEVYNLHTSENWYNANSIMTHNCRCILVPARVEGALTVSPITAAITDEVDVEDIPVDELEDGEEEVTEIPVHGVAAIEGRPTGDGRKFALGAVTFGDLPQPLGYEFESSHGGGNSRVAIVGRIDEFFKVEVDDIVEIRFRGVIFPGKPYAAQAIEGIIDQSYRGLSVIVDDMALDVETTKADFDATEDGQTVVETLSAARIRRFDMVPTGAYQEGWLNLGHEFASELGDDALAACAACAGGDDDEDDENIERGYDLYDDQMITVNLGRIGEEELAALDALSVEEQIQYQIEHGMVEAIESYREVSTAERRKLAEEGKALPDGSFPIATEEDLENAIQAIGRASNPDEVKALIKKRAADLGRSDLVPEDWALVASAFAPGTKDGEVGTLVAWNARYQSAAATQRSAAGAASTTAAGSGMGTRSASAGTHLEPMAQTGLTDAPTTMSAGSGPDMSTGKATVASLSLVESADQLIASFTSAASDPFRMGLFSTTFAATVGASTPDISSLSLAQRTSLAAMLITAGLESSVETASMTSRIPTTGSGSPKASGHAELAGTQAADASRSEKLSDVTVLAGRLIEAFSNPTTRDSPGWITHPIPTGRIRRYWVRGKGAAKIRWGVPGDFNRCRRQLAKYIVNPKWLAGACANMHREALGVWPGQEKGFGSKSEGMSMSVALVASGTVIEKPADAFKDPGFSRLTPLTIDGDRIYGHLAQWGVCHIGIQDVCVTAPHSSTNYSMYRTGVVFTDEGRLPVGQITMGTGHASIKANAKEAVAHYDNTGSVVADVVAGEDAFGIWFAGLLRPGLTPERIAQLAASALSGDWRRTMTGLELVAALAVNVPGYPIPRVSLSASALAGQESLVAAGIVELDAVTAGLVPSSEEIAGIVRTAVDEYRHAEAREARIEALRPFGDKAREHSLARIATYFEGE